MAESKVQLLINKCNEINKSDKGLDIDTVGRRIILNGNYMILQ